MAGKHLFFLDRQSLERFGQVPAMLVLFPVFRPCAPYNAIKEIFAMSRIESALSAGRKCIVLSPHLDDGAWSCGGLMARAAEAGCAVEAVTVYTGSPPDTDLPKLQQKELSEHGSMEERKKEDSAALAILGAKPVWWDVPARIFRKPWLANRLEVFKTPEAEVIQGACLYNTIVERVADLITQNPAALIFCPLGAGHMYDHVELFTACINAAHNEDAFDQVCFYEDSYAILTGSRKAHFLLKEYVWKNKNAPQNASFWWRAMGQVMTRSASNADIRTGIPEALKTAKWQVYPVDIMPVFDKKMKSLAHYISQMRQFGGMKRVTRAFERYHAFWNGCEPFWFILDTHLLADNQQEASNGKGHYV